MASYALGAQGGCASGAHIVLELAARLFLDLATTPTIKDIVNLFGFLGPYLLTHDVVNTRV
jgi:hypothetical protein